MDQDDPNLIQATNEPENDNTPPDSTLAGQRRPVLRGEIVEVPKRFVGNPDGRQHAMTEERIQAVENALKRGVPLHEVFALAGISGPTYYKWMKWGNLLNQLELGEPLSDSDLATLPPKEEDCAIALDFYRRCQKARAEMRANIVGQILDYSLKTWTHKLTGEVRYEPPPGPFTWTNRLTGEIRFEPPDGPNGSWIDFPPDAQYGAANLDDDEVWSKQWSGDAWAFDKGDWKPMGWFLERSSPEDWARRKVVQQQGEVIVTVRRGEKKKGG